MQRPEWLRPPRGVRWTPTVGVAGAAALLLVALAMWGLLGLGSSLLQLPFASSENPSEGLTPALQRGKALAELDASGSTAEAPSSCRRHRCERRPSR